MGLGNGRFARRFHEPCGLPLEEDIQAVVDGRQLRRFDGSDAAVAHVNAHSASPPSRPARPPS